MATWSKVCDVADLNSGRPVGVDVDGALVGLYLIDGSVYALGDVCTHAFALLSDGFVEGGEVECPLHAARFEIATGRCTEGPADTDVPSIPVRVEEGAVLLDMDALAALDVHG
jgi:naphthalene 1,2-dioxygenase system ferredoxin subunit